MPSKARLSKIDRRLTPKQKSPPYVFQVYANPWWTDKPVVNGPDGVVDELPPGARSVTITYTDSWRPASKSTAPGMYARAGVAVEVEGAAPIPTPEQQVAEDGSIIEEVLEPAPPPPSGWQVKRPSGAAIANYVDGQDFYRGADRISATVDMVAEMVSLAANDTPADQVYPSREIAMSEALARLERCVAAYHDDGDG